MKMEKCYATNYFSDKELRAKSFDEKIFHNAPVFFGLAMESVRNPSNDLACLSMLLVNPITEVEYFKDWYFIPQYWEKHIRVSSNTFKTKHVDMVAKKSKVDAGILYDKEGRRYGYRMYADRGDVVIVDKKLVKRLTCIYGTDSDINCTSIAQKFILRYLAWLESVYRFTTCKVGLNPMQESVIETFINANIRSIDGLPTAVKFIVEQPEQFMPIMGTTKDVRARGLVHCNNKLTELHFANAQVKTCGNGYEMYNQTLTDNSGVKAQLAARSAYGAFVSNVNNGK